MTLRGSRKFYPGKESKIIEIDSPGDEESMQREEVCGNDVDQQLRVLGMFDILLSNPMSFISAAFYYKEFAILSKKEIVAAALHASTQILQTVLLLFRRYD